MRSETGTVKWFSNKRGYGFIRRSDGTEIFVHHTDIQGDGFRTLRAGERVQFQTRTDERGPRAAYVLHADSTPPEPGGLPTLAEQLEEKLAPRFFR